MKRAFSFLGLAIAGVSMVSAQARSADAVGQLLLGLGIAGPILALTLSIAFIVAFFQIAKNVSKICEYQRKLFLYERVRMIQDGLLDNASGKLKGWRIAEDQLFPDELAEDTFPKA